MPLYAIGDRQPNVDPTAFVHPEAVVIGAVFIGPQASVWPGAVLRGDSGAIHVGTATSIQDGTVIHCTGEWDTVVGDRCVVGHRVHLEGCTIEEGSLVGSGSVILQGARIGSGSLVAAQALVPPGLQVPPASMARGVPARIVDQAPDRAMIDHSVEVYVRNARWYSTQMRRLD